MPKEGKGERAQQSSLLCPNNRTQGIPWPEVQVPQ